MNVTYTFIEDPGHGWLKVPMMDLMVSGVMGKITSYSYYTRDHAYLEEDCDAGTFIDALRSQGKTVNFKTVVVADFDEYRNKLGRVVRFTGK
jgi:hypothetical protein